jgi:hypothetical protein
MRINKILYNSLYIVFPFFLIIYLLFCINILIKDFSYGHKSHNFNPSPHNWLSYKIDYFKFNFTNFFLNRNQEDGLKRVDLFIPDKTKNKLLSNIPSSTKKYLPSKMVINNNIQDTMVRYLGDNPVNYMLEKKSLRIKTRKTEVYNKKRYFEYRFTQTTPISHYLSFKLAKKIGLLVSDVKLVELFINGKSKGIFLEKERLNEGFLRRNKIMPINLYKGEQSRNIENKIGLQDDLIKNSGMWEKSAVSNYFELEDKSDLKIFLDNLKNSENNPDSLTLILDNGNKELLAKLMLLEILLQQQANNDMHNQRIAIDTWSGKIYHIPHDIEYNLENMHEDNLFSDISPSSLNRYLNQSSVFLDKKFELIFEYVNNQKILREAVKELTKIKKQYLISEKRDFGSYQRKFFKNKNIDVKGNENFINFSNSLIQREREIIDAFNEEPTASWEIDGNNFFIKVNQIFPLSKFTINFKEGNPKWVALDLNNNLILDDKDIFFEKNKDNSFFLDISLFSNRIPILNLGKKHLGYKTHLSNTKFKFFVSDNSQPNEIYSYNKYVKKKYKLKKIKDKSYNPTKNNIPIINISKNKVRTFSEEVFIENDLIIKEEVIIKKGTIFYLSKGASIIFKNKIIANGTTEQPIIFKPKKSGQIWGTVAIHGPKTNNSSLKNVLIEGGSGDIIDGINYFASLSIHSSENIKFHNIAVKNNFIYDDLVHVIYSKNLYFENLDLLNAYKDAIDIDISSNINLKNSNIINSGNDGIDLMESQVNVDKCYVDNNGDKGISVGEGSELYLNNCQIKNSKYGIASKDASIAKIKKSEFIDNLIQLSTYKKNWRYNASGKIFLENSNLFSKEKNKLIGDKYGEINILSSTFEGSLIKEGNVFIN